MNPKSQEIRSEFLRLLVKQLIINLPSSKKSISPKESAGKMKEQIKYQQPAKPEPVEMKESAASIPSIVQKQEQAKMPESPQRQQMQSSPPPKEQENMVGMQLNPSVQELNEPSPQSPMIQKQPLNVLRPAAPRPPQKPRPVAVANTMKKLTIRGLARLEGLLADTTIQTVECPGPGKQVLVFRSGSIQTTNIALTLEEINDVMKEISEKTRIPLISGVFKAALPDYVITAVMSEFVGTRFIITKKPPVPAQMPQ